MADLRNLGQRKFLAASAAAAWLHAGIAAPAAYASRP